MSHTQESNQFTAEAAREYQRSLWKDIIVKAIRAAIYYDKASKLKFDHEINADAVDWLKSMGYSVDVVPHGRSQHTIIRW